MREPSKLTAYFSVRRMLQNPPMECGPVERNVLLLMSGWADPDGSNIIQSYDTLSAVGGYSKSAVRRAVDFWLASPGILILMKPGGGRGRAPEYAINLAKVESFITDKSAVPKHLSGNKGAVGKHLSEDGKMLPESTKGATKVHKCAVERHPPSSPSLPDRSSGKSSPHDPVERSERRESSNGDRLDDFKKKVLAKCKDPDGVIAVALDVIVGRARRSGINVTSPNYLEEALQRFDFHGGQDREDWMAARRGRASDR